MKNRFIQLIIIVSTFTSIELPAQTSTARFLYLSPSAEATALGGAGVSIANNSFAAYYNPASFAFTKTQGLSASFMKPFSPFKNTSMGTISAFYPIESAGTIALTFNSFWNENQIRTSSNDPSPIGEIRDSPALFKPTNYQIKISYANKIEENVAFGFSASYLHIVLANKPTEQEVGSGITSTMLFDGGLLITDLFINSTYSPDSKTNISSSVENIRPGCSIGFSILNLGPKISFIDNAQSDPPPAFALLGISYTPIYWEPMSSRISLDIEKRIYDSNELDFVHLGGEFLVYKFISLRLGFSANLIREDNSFFTYGFGFNYKFISVNVSSYKKYAVPTWQFDAKIFQEF